MGIAVFRRGLLQLISSGQSSIRGCALVAANFGLAFPVLLVEDLYLVLEGNQCVRLPNPAELVLELIWEPVIELPVERFVVPAGARRVSVEVESIFDGLACVPVPQVLDVDSGVVDGVTWAEKTAEFIDEHL